MTDALEDGPEDEMEIDELIAAMTKLRHSMDVDQIWNPLNRKHIIVLLAANYIVATNEILFEGNRASALEMAANLHKNICNAVNWGLDSGGMSVDGVAAGHA